MALNATAYQMTGSESYGHKYVCISAKTAKYVVPSANKYFQ